MCCALIVIVYVANVGPWKKLAADRKLTLKTWGSSPIPGNQDNPYAVQLSTTNLVPLITSKTRLVSFTACSNILGSITDVAEVVREIRHVAREKGARKVEVCVDCVAYAPHRRIDVRKWDVDYCFFSYYKVCNARNLERSVRGNNVTAIGLWTPHFHSLCEGTFFGGISDFLGA